MATGKTAFLRVGDQMPMISTTDIFGEPFVSQSFLADSGNHNGKSLLTFMRNVDCIFCNLQIHKLKTEQKAFEKAGIRVVIFMQSPAEQMRADIHEANFPYTLIADPEKQFYNQIGSENSWLKYAKAAALAVPALRAQMKGFKIKLLQRGEQNLMPADFLINAEGKILAVNYGQSVADHLSLNAIFSA